MKDVIIPVDFSETSLNAARYAADMLTGRTDTKVVLYNMHEHDADAEISRKYLVTLKNEFESKGVMNVECCTEKGDDLIDSLGRLAYQKTAELIVMGITDKEEWRQVFQGSNTLKMAEQNVCPVMIIPNDAKYTGIKNIALTSDFQDVASTTPALAIKTVLELFDASLHIINVDSEHYVALTDSYLAERSKMQEMFADFNPEFYFIGMNDFQEAVTQFATDRNIDLIIIIPKNHTFFNNLFSSSHTRKLAYQSAVPLLAAHQ